MRRLALLIPLLLLATACAPVVYVTPAGSDGVVLPEQAQRVIDSYTATARVMATQAAQATAAGQSARETSTAAAQGTLGWLSAQQTQVGMELTQGAGLALATDAAAARTQAAGQTQAAATPTAVAQRTQAAISADDRRQQLASAAAMAEFWQTLRAVFVALVIVGGLSLIVVRVIDRVSQIRVATLRERAAIAREAFRILPPGHWAEWQPSEGYQVYPLPGQLDEPALIIEAISPTPNRAHAWRQAVRLFCWWGDRYGFGIRELMAAGVVTDPAWRPLARLLKDAGVLADMKLPGQKGRVTHWADQWNYQRLSEELGKGKIALPFPIDQDPPKVAFTVPTQHQN